mgnify:CR=1 FL=1
MEVRRAENIKAYITKDGSEIREIFHPNNFPESRMSVAMASLNPGKSTVLHYHKSSDEIYFILSGSGLLEIEGEKREVSAGDYIYIKAGQKHKVENLGEEPLKIVCFSYPPYSHEDTVLLE